LENCKSFDGPMTTRPATAIMRSSAGPRPKKDWSRVMDLLFVMAMRCGYLDDVTSRQCDGDNGGAMGG